MAAKQYSASQTQRRSYGYDPRQPARTIDKPMSGKKIRDIDHTFLILVILMVIAGLVMLFSASAPTGSTKFQNSYFFIMRQFGYAVLGLVAMFFIANIDYRKYKHYSIHLMLFCIFLLFLVITPLGSERNGAQRWLWNFQPSELTKFAVAAYCAYMIELGTFDVTKVKNLLPYAIIVGTVVALLLLEPHLSCSIIVLSIVATVLIVGGANWRLFGGIGAVAGGLGIIVVKNFVPYAWARVASFLDPFADTSGKGYQVIQGLYAISLGGLFGRGLGQSVQKSTFLPEPYNDFIFTIVCEELGFIGAFAIIALFCAIIFHGLKIAFRAQDKFGMLTVIGIMAQIGIQTAFNIAVATSSIPCTGISLPFFSYGGTSLFVLLLEMGFVLSVSKYGIQPNVEKLKRSNVSEKDGIER